MEPYRLTFYESGYIDPKEFEKKHWAEMVKKLGEVFKTNLPPEEPKRFHGCGFLVTEKDKGV